MRGYRAIVSSVVLAIAVTACSSSPAPAPATSEPSTLPGPVAATLAVYGASSLKTALVKLKKAYEAAAPGVTIVVSTDSSAALEAKIEQGAPADVFLSADTTNPQKLVARSLALGAPTRFAGNLLTVIVPKANPAGIMSPVDLAQPGIKIIAAGDEVPITKYTTQLVSNLAGQPGYPDQFASRYAVNVVSKEDNVAAVVAKVELGEGDAAIVYTTDARASTKVATIAVPGAADVPATYAGIVVAATRQPDAAKAFLAWVAGSDGQAILGSLGFVPPS